MKPIRFCNRALSPVKINQSVSEKVNSTEILSIKSSRFYSGSKENILPCNFTLQEQHNKDEDQYKVGKKTANEILPIENSNASDISSEISLSSPQFYGSPDSIFTPEESDKDNTDSPDLETPSPASDEMLDSNYVPFDDSSEKSSGSPEINNFSSHFCPKQVNKDELNIEEQSNSPSSSVSLNIHQHVEETCNINTKSLKKSVFCYFCESVVLNFPRHILRNHQSELEVQKILVYPPRSKTRKQLLFALRKKGNYLLGSANLKPVRKGSADTNYLPCDHCFGMYSAKNLWRHRKICNPYSVTRNSQSQAQNFLLRHLKLDTYLKETVFPRIRADNVSLVAKKDPLICAFGSRYLKIHREQHFIPVASRKMRELAKIVIELRKNSSSIKTLFGSLKPEYYDSLVFATKIVSKYDNESKTFKAPSFAKNIGTTLKQCCDIALMLNAKKSEFTVRSASAKADLKSLIQIIEGNWKYDISSQAANDLDMKK
ncbi:uncharacterized protein [Diabrotica undecimpunctata]|uniref:uncharacterized protein n=1 Tax=Diabrotica undecimpunctata TaxID=50387 RepID=UPI003B6323B2